MVVLVATVRALKYHGNGDAKDLSRPDPETLRKGLGNLEKHIENINLFGIRPVVAINRFSTDTEEEINIIREKCDEMGVNHAVAEAWEKGGAGTLELAELVIKEAAACDHSYTPLYDWNMSIPEKIETVAKKIYGAKAIDYRPKALSDLKKIETLGLEKVPVCIAKTQKSLSDNPKLLGRPKDFIVTVREIEIAAGAGFVVPITGNIMRMPGLPEEPAAERIDIDEHGRITGLF